MLEKIMIKLFGLRVEHIESAIRFSKEPLLLSAWQRASYGGRSPKRVRLNDEEKRAYNQVAKRYNGLDISSYLDFSDCDTRLQELPLI